jgi:hypothetical protein
MQLAMVDAADTGTVNSPLTVAAPKHFQALDPNRNVLQREYGSASHRCILSI